VLSRVWKWALCVGGVVFILGAGLIVKQQWAQKSLHSQITLEAEKTMFSIKDSTITTPYGVFDVQEPVIFALLQSAAMQRIRNVQQYGPMSWVKKAPEFSRYSHCLGVWAVLRRFNAPLNEQIAGLLHDVSHTVFSHLGDHIFNHGSMLHSYQDEIHEWFLRKYGIDRVLSTYGIELRDVMHKNGTFKALESDLPDLCADRIEYNLRGGLVEGLLAKEDIEPILAALRWDNERWYFVDPIKAVQLARVSLYLTEHEWGSPSNNIVSDWMVKAIRRAFDLQVVTLDEIHFSTDDVIWERLTQSPDPIIKNFMFKALNYKDQFKFVDDPALADITVRSKCRGVNPWVLVKGEFKRLTDVDESYAKDFERTKQLVQTGWFVKFHDSADAQGKAVLQGV
jgi:uncharacterized protein